MAKDSSSSNSSESCAKQSPAANGHFLVLLGALKKRAKRLYTWTPQQVVSGGFGGISRNHLLGWGVQVYFLKCLMPKKMLQRFFEWFYWQRGAFLGATRLSILGFA